MNTISYFFIAAAVGFIVMAAITIQALEALLTTPILIRKAYETDPDFRVEAARRRSRQVAILLTIPSIIICAIVCAFLSSALLWGYWFGFAVALVVSYQRFQPNRVENQEKFKQSYIDCFSDFQPPVAETATDMDDDDSDDDDNDDPDVVPVSRPR